ncbi:MAG: cytochrome c family protein [Methylobacterium sp.]|nr:cytochrome c family protein [Methylobacterium sp.]
MLRAFALSALVLLPAASALAQDAEAGKSVFNQCRACHQVGETARNGAGPVLNGLFGRKAGTVTGYNYSEANKNSGIIWDETNFAAYIKDPKVFMPGNKMAYAGLKDDKRIADLIAYLKTFGPDGKPK